MSQSQTAIDANTIRQIIRKMGHNPKGMVSVRNIADEFTGIHLDVKWIDQEEFEHELNRADLPGNGRDYSIEW